MGGVVCVCVCLCVCVCVCVCVCASDACHRGIRKNWPNILVKGNAHFHDMGGKRSTWCILAEIHQGEWVCLYLLLITPPSQSPIFE